VPHYFPLMDSANHDQAQALRYKHLQGLLALEAKHVAEEERCYDTSLIAAAIVRAHLAGDADGLADFGIAPGPDLDAAVAAAIAAL
jgi:hypothetical protein